MAVLLVGIVVTGALAASAWFVHDENEERLLHQRAQEGAAVLNLTVPIFQLPLASAAALAAADDGDPAAFRGYIDEYIGETFSSATLYRLPGGEGGDGAAAPVTTVGLPPALAARPPDRVQRFLAHAARSESLSVLAMLDGTPGILGWAFSPVEKPTQFVVYAETPIPEDPTAVVQTDEAFSDIDYALYVDRDARPEDLVFASTRDLPLSGETASEVLEFGDARPLLVVSARGGLGGALLARLPWIIGLAGGLLTLGAAMLTERLLRRRDEAEQLAGDLATLADDNARLYAEQRDLAQTLQRSLLPARLPTVPRVELAARYEPGAEGVDIGGDWYDVVPLADRRLLLVIGDVSGRGLEAGITMASLRFAIRAYAAEDPSPHGILEKLSRLIDVSDDGAFATVLCAVFDGGERTITVANAGHPAPLLVNGAGARFLDTAVGLPIGIARSTYEERVEPAGDHGTLLAFTDGLYERRDESIEHGLERVRAAGIGDGGSLDAVLDRVIGHVAGPQRDDDLAVLAVRWRR